MGKVIAQASMSLDGFIADTNNQAGPLFDWYNNGNAEVTGADPGLVFHTSPASAEYLRAAWSAIGADVIGRRLFDLTNGWNGRPAVGEHVFVVTHQPLVPGYVHRAAACHHTQILACTYRARLERHTNFRGYMK